MTTQLVRCSALCCAAWQAKAKLLLQFLGVRAFQQLRTKEKLGYVVSAFLRADYGVLGLAFRIQSPKNAPAVICARVEAFLVSFEAEMEALPPRDFEETRETLAAKLLDFDKTMRDQHRRLWREIAHHNYNWSRATELPAAIGSVSHAQLLAFFRRHLGAASAERRRLTVQVYCSAHEDATVASATAEAQAGRTILLDVMSVALFRKESDLFPNLLAERGPELQVSSL